MINNKFRTKLIFLHIPKTAGLSLNAELISYFGSENSIRIQNKEDREILLSMDSNILNKYDFISGHFSITEMKNKKLNGAFISVVREPFDRIRSLFNYIKGSDHLEHQKFKNLDIGEFINEMLEKDEINLQCWHLCGEPNYNNAVDSIVENSIYVVPMELYADLLETLSKLLGHQFSYTHINKTNYQEKYSSIRLDSELYDKIIGDDIKIYNYALNNYSEIKDSFLKRINIL